jgi:hypothetical protein
MRHATRDHGEIIHWAGRHARNPSIDAQAQLSLSPSGPAAAGERRLGWEAFFPAFDAAGLSLVYDDASDFHRLVSATEAARILREEQNPS